MREQHLRLSLEEIMRDGYWVFQTTAGPLRHYVPIRVKDKDAAALEARRQYPFALDIRAHARLPASWPFRSYTEPAPSIEAVP
jgi:hypothetical protein